MTQAREESYEARYHIEQLELTPTGYCEYMPDTYLRTVLPKGVRELGAFVCQIQIIG